MTTPDVKGLIAEVAARHGIALRPDDPVFALVTVNQLVLEQTMIELIGRTQQMTNEFDQAATRLQARAGIVLAAEVRKAGAEIRQALRQDITAAGIRPRQSAEEIERVQSGPFSCWRLSAGLIAALALFVMGILVGRLWR
jgi:Transcriptional activator TraM